MNKVLLILLISFFAVFLFVATFVPGIKYPLSILGTNQPIIFAHRGSRVLNPENTLQAFRIALEFGADVIETDVQLTKDRALVIFHDDRVDRVTNAQGRVAEFTLEELRQLDLGYRFTHDNGTTFPFRGKGVHISTPEEVFDAFPDTYFNIELKNPDIRSAELLYDAIMKKSMQNRVVVGGRWCPSVRHFRTISAAQNIQTSACESEVISFLFQTFARTSSFWYSMVSPLNAHSLQIPIASGPFQLDTASFFSALKKIGKHVHYWVINDPTEMKRLLELGADGIITDRPDIAVQVFESLGLKTKQDRDIYKHENTKYYVPVDKHVEVHTCVGIVCAVLQNLYTSLSVFVGIIAIIILWRKHRSNKKQKQA